MAVKKDNIHRTGGNGRRSTCVSHKGLVYFSGITSVDLEADTAGQAQDILAQIDKLLSINGSDRNHILSTTVYLKTMDDYAAFNSVWDMWIADGHEPARTVVGAQLALPEYRVKVELIAAEVD